MTDPYPKDREELLVENNQLRSQIASLQATAASLERAVRVRDGEIAVLRRRKPPHQLEPKAKDAFSRPAYSR